MSNNKAKIKTEVNEKILGLWRDEHKTLNLGFRHEKIDKTAELFWPNLHFEAPNEVDLLIVGLNPSHKFKGHKGKLMEKTGKSSNQILNIIEQTDYTPTDNIVEALLYGGTEFKMQEIEEFEKLAHDLHGYFQKFKDLAEQVTGKKDSHYHIDLYQFRHANSKIFLGLVNRNKDFFEKQKKLTFDYVEKLRPKMIFVANKNSSQAFIENYDNKFSQEHGCHFLNIGDKKIPLILSGMITQSRAIDDYSYQRLVWHMKKIFERPNPKE